MGDGAVGADRGQPAATEATAQRTFPHGRQHRGMNEYPTPWQQKTMWSALAALSVVAIAGIAVGLIWRIFTVIGFLQPILIPFGVGGVMAYPLYPGLSRLGCLGPS